MSPRPSFAAAAVAATLCGALSPQVADAFCGFYVAGADASLYNDATQVVLMRGGTRTILSMQNNYQGPAGDFAMVVPVPVILQEDNVKTLDAAIFAKVDTMTAPRLVEYWEQDPCNPPWDYDNDGGTGGGDPPEANPSPSATQVTVEAEFTVGEYHVVILSASDATALESWLTGHDYNIPDGSAPYLDPYIQSGMYFFVAEVDAAKVEVKGGLAVLSPLRFHYDTEDFSLPIRLGLINSTGSQDLLVYTLGQDQRFDVANYPNATIPTNIEVQNEVREDFGSFYEALFQRTLEVNPGAVITEYAWNASSCDPCPGPVLDPSDYLTLGADVLPGQPTGQWVITRLHARYHKDNPGEDLVFRTADPIVGGRERYTDGALEQSASPSSYNNFQGRYIIRHPWEGPVECEQPNYGIWGGPPGGGESSISPATSPNTQGASPQSISPGVLEDLVAQDIPEIGVDLDAPPGETPVASTPTAGGGQPTDPPGQTAAPTAAQTSAPTTPTAADGSPAASSTPTEAGDTGGCGCRTRDADPAGALSALTLLTLVTATARRRRRVARVPDPRSGR